MFAKSSVLRNLVFFNHYYSLIIYFIGRNDNYRFTSHFLKPLGPSIFSRRSMWNNIDYYISIPPRGQTNPCLQTLSSIIISKTRNCKAATYQTPAFLCQEVIKEWHTIYLRFVQEFRRPNYIHSFFRT